MSDFQDDREPRQMGLRGIQVGESGVPLDHDDLYKVPGPPDMSDVQKKILKEAKKRFDRAQKFFSVSRARQLDDLKFSEADSYNGYQWPNDIKNGRDIDNKPSLTINKTRQHCLIIINETMQHKASMRFRPMGNSATTKSAQIMNSMARHIENQSNADDVYQNGTNFQVRTGFGAWKVTTKYVDEETFDQEIFILPIKDPRTVYFDPDAKQDDKSDGQFAFLFEDLPKDVFDARFPEFHGHAPRQPFGNDIPDNWITEDSVRIAEYYRKVTTKDVLISYTDSNTGEMKAMLQSTMPKELIKAALADPETRTRVVDKVRIKYYLIVGDTIVSEKDWPGKYIPIVPCLGEETMIDGTYDCKGHTRALLDSQRMFNYWASAAVEYGALQSKTPYLAPVAAIENLQGYWDTANVENHSFLPWNHIDEDGNPIPMPQRAPSPQAAPLYMEGMKQTLSEMELVTGQYANQMGQQGNERTGKAIQERQRQSATATYHFVNGQSKAIRYTAKIIGDLIPIIYDTKRVMQILDEKGKSIEVTVDPTAQQVYSEELNADAQAVARVFNPALGKYDVYADTGPDFATSQEEAWNGFVQILTQSPQLTTLIGDLALRNANFPGSDEAADRLERMLPPQAKPNGPTPAELQLKKENVGLMDQIKKLVDQLASANLKLTGKDQMREIDAYDAETKRIAAMAKMLPTDPEGLAVMIQQLVQDTVQTHLKAALGAQSLLAQASASQGDPSNYALPGPQQTPQGGGGAPNPQPAPAQPSPGGQAP